MLAKADEGKPQRGGRGGGKKRRHPAEDGESGDRKRRGGEEDDKGQGDGGKTRLDALSVGYFRRVGERLSEGFEDNEEKGEKDYFSRDLSKQLTVCSRKAHYSSTALLFCSLIIPLICLSHSLAAKFQNSQTE